jgi:hypothetical protein
MVDVDGIVDVEGVDDQVRDPRLPELKPLPRRASAPDASRPGLPRPPRKPSEPDKSCGT